LYEVGFDSLREEVVGGSGTDDGDGSVEGGVAASVTGRRRGRRVLARRGRGRRNGRGHSTLKERERRGWGSIVSMFSR